MKEGILLVRLRTSEKIIMGLKDIGEFERAREVELEQRIENLEIAAAFKQSFDFCPVYFFYSNCSKDVRMGNYSDCLIDFDLKKLEDPPVGLENYFTAEFSHIQKSDDAYFQDNVLRYDTTGYKSQQKTYAGGTELGPDALIVMDRNFRQLGGGFPSWVRTYEGFPVLRRKKPKAVARLNQALHEFYRKASN